MFIKRCRVCGNKFFKEPLLKYNNLPRAVQYLPSKKETKKEKGIDLKVYQCSGCGLVQLNSPAVPYYKEVIRAVGISPEMKKFRKKQFSDFIEKFSLKGKKIIEIGCGQGDYLSVLAGVGVKAFGIEYSSKNVRECLKKGLKVQKGFLEKENYKLKNAPFDAFLIFSFLEHLPNPNSVLRAIYNNLKEEGMGMVEVPNFDMILEKKLFSEFMTDAIVKKRKRLDLSDFNKRQKKIKKEIEKYISRFKKVAIWGAGHQALTIMALINLGKKVKYVIDSAPFKQGKFTPVTHIPIVSPETLNLDPVDAVIVIAGSYSDEVTRIIRQKYDKNTTVVILINSGLEVI